MSELIGLVDDQDRPLNKTAAYERVKNEGLWHRAAHVVIYTPDKQIVMQTRSLDLDRHPGEVEVSVGGLVAAGETPEQAIVREVKEELGITLPDNSLTSLGKTKFNHAGDRAFVYSYSACLDKDQLNFKPQDGEATAMFLLPLKDLKRALTRHRLKKFGRIVPIYAYWRSLIKGLEHPPKKLNLHFVCRGNTFRSRIAEAIVNAKQLQNITASSSGIDADQSIKLAPWAEFVLRQHDLPLNPHPTTQTTAKILKAADKVIALSKDVHKDWPTWPRSTVTWDIKDINQRIAGSILDVNDPHLQQQALQVYNEIDSQINDLLMQNSARK